VVVVAPWLSLRRIRSTRSEPLHALALNFSGVSIVSSICDNRCRPDLAQISGLIPGTWQLDTWRYAGMVCSGMPAFNEDVLRISWHEMESLAIASSNRH
jgi:hypothetical protein